VDFPETRWSSLLELKDPASPRYAEQMEALARLYWPPVYHYVRALKPNGEAEDLTQQFFAMLLARRDLEKLSPERGSFRGFLKTALRHFVASASRGPRANLKLPFEDAEAAWRNSAPGLSPEAAFDREWARSVLLEGVRLLKLEVPPDRFELFQKICQDASYEEAGRSQGRSADDVRNRLREMRARLREILRELLRDTLAPGEDVEAELRLVLGA
jgi:RNA polymerase sigma factor (sigma-70 family)